MNSPIRPPQPSTAPYNKATASKYAPPANTLRTPPQNSNLRTSFKTPKGTELPLLNLRGKEYLLVPYRIVWFREEHPDWSINTEILDRTDTTAIVRATIKNEKGDLISTAIKSESKGDFGDFLEKAETGAIGRALALSGYGTAFAADDLFEGERIVDAPLSK